MNDDDLSKAMTAQVEGIDASPDLGAVLADADRRRRRTRAAGLSGAAAVVVLGAGGFFVLADRDADTQIASTPVATEAPATTAGESSGRDDADESRDGDGASTAPAETAAPTPVSTLASEPADDAAAESGPGFVDAAAPFLEQTSELYRRTMPSGYDLQVRASDVSYGELFGIDWDLPTGSAEECLGAPAIFIGDPVGTVQWVSAWSVHQWEPLGDDEPFIVTEVWGDDRSFLVVRSNDTAWEIGIEQGGEFTDVARFENGIAAVEMLPFGADQFPGDEDGPTLSFATRQPDGVFEADIYPVYNNFYGERNVPKVCFAPSPPGSTLPPPGEQPADAAAAEQQIRERHAVLVDQSLTADQKPEDLLDDNTGVSDARAEIESGQFAESAAGAEYTIAEVVFSDPTTAWFEYEIVAPTGTFGPRFGTATFKGDVWQISRATICQDLSLAGGSCDPGQPTPQVQPPLADGVDPEVAQREWEVLANRYMNARNCHPLQPCGDFDSSRQLPDPGEQPADAAASEQLIGDLMSSLYGAGVLADNLGVLDDATGVAEALDAVGDGGFADAANSAAAAIDELVFVEPTLAAFRYTLSTSSGIFADRMGSAVRIDGEWKVTRATVCADLSLAGGSCDAS